MNTSGTAGGLVASKLAIVCSPYRIMRDRFSHYEFTDCVYVVVYKVGRGQSG